ncbi:hypothetical protein GCM10020295_79690 [Streptomyces cinereospinus]
MITSPAEGGPATPARLGGTQPELFGTDALCTGLSVTGHGLAPLPLVVEAALAKVIQASSILVHRTRIEEGNDAITHARRRSQTSLGATRRKAAAFLADDEGDLARSAGETA